ncbi:uncharacterized protein [Physcomitrium patens]|uniref:Transmembrane protein 69 n=1 Tax=Physcomitrium patens TaxID=3218 RepID=A0A2K1JYZ9_PHYPA|nr:uncharacterized protein LOC112287285 isoform X1 [Physcomitrium patens]PNR46749.1 hypothetical protein PHYPA_013869 [Physcomitrium patens]|eukprot:XP_024385924.1 uncharacterized protein LOC112287285 isoform X1 [Physcomitrella patens]
MRAGHAAGRALFRSLHRICHNPQVFFSCSSSNFLPKLSSIAPVFRIEEYGVGFGSSPSFRFQCTYSFASKAAMDSMDSLRGLTPSICASGSERASTGCFRPRSHNHVFLQGFATQMSTKTPQTPTQTSAQAPTNPELSAATPRTISVLPSGTPSEQSKPKKSGALKQMFLGFGAVPFPALLLGAAGLIPFVALTPPLAQMLPIPAIVAVSYADAQAAYGASIVSFLGAIHWGLAMADYAAPGKGGVANMTLMTTRYVWSVVPSLMAWTALLLPPGCKFALLIFSLWTALGVDFVYARLKLVPYWFLSLRWPLTLVASVSMVPSMLAAAAWTY